MPVTENDDPRSGLFLVEEAKLALSESTTLIVLVLLKLLLLLKMRVRGEDAVVEGV